MQNMAIKKIIKKLLAQDHGDRSSSKFKKFSPQKRLSLIAKRDGERINLLKKLLEALPKLDAIDYFRAALIFRYGRDVESLKLAINCAIRSMNLGYDPAKWLYADITDISLLIRGKKQKFGTQFGKGQNGKWRLLPVSARTTDHDRKEYNVISIKETKKLEGLLNSNRMKDFFKPAYIGLTMRSRSNLT